MARATVIARLALFAVVAAAMQFFALAQVEPEMDDMETTDVAEPVAESMTLA